MRILLLVQYYFPNIQSCAQLMHDLGLELAERGHEVVLATLDESVTGRREVGEEEGLTVIRARSGAFRDVPLPIRAYNEWRIPSALWSRAGDLLAERPFDLVVAYSPPIFFGPLVRRLKKRWGTRAYLVLRDIFPQWSVDAGVMRRGGPVYRFFRRHELALYDAVDVIGVQSERNLDYFRREGLADRYRLEVLHNWARDRRQEAGVSPLRRQLGIEDRVVFLYGGNLGVAQDPSCLARLAEACRSDPRAFFLVIGEGSERDLLAGEIERRRLDNMRLLAPLDQDAYRAAVADADVGLITLRADLGTHNFPGKLLDYLCQGKPTLAAINPGNDLQDLLERHRAGLVSVAGDDETLAANALRLASDPALRRDLGGRGRRLFEEVFSPARAAERILALGSARA